MFVALYSSELVYHVKSDFWNIHPIKFRVQDEHQGLLFYKIDMLQAFIHVISVHRPLTSTILNHAVWKRTVFWLIKINKEKKIFSVIFEGLY